MAGGFFDTSNQAGIDSELSVNPVGTQSATYSTQEDSPGGFFQSGQGEVGVQGVPVEVANAAAREAAKNAAGWAVGDSDTELSGWTADRNAKAYSNDASESASQALNSANVAAAAATAAQTADQSAEEALAAAQEARDAAQLAETAAENARDAAIEIQQQIDSDSEEIAAILDEINQDSETVRADRRQVKADSENIADYARSTKADSEYVSDIREELDSDIKVDSEARTAVQRAIERDSEQADSDAHRAELEADVAEAYARGQGPLASYWVSTDTDQGSHTFEAGHDPDGSRTIFDLAGLGSDRGINITGHTFAVYQDFALQAADTYTISDGVSGAIDDAFITFSTAPATGTRLDVFLLPPGNRTYGPHSNPYISSEQSAIWLAEQSQNNVIASVVHDTDITIVAGSGLSGGGTFTTNQADSENITLSLDNNVVVNADTEGNTLTLTQNDGSTVTFTATSANDTDITIVAGTGLNGGGTFTTDQAAAEEITLNLDSEVIVDASVSGNTLTLTRNDTTTVAFTTADAGSSTFLEDSDTPNSYANQNGNFPRVNADTDALEFFNPFPVANNRLTVLNGLTIRRFEGNAIVFATFEPTGLSVEADPSNFVNWDAPITGFTFRGTNDPLVQDTHLTNITNYTVNSTARTISTNYSAYSATERTWVDTADYVDPNNWDGGQVSYTVAGTINDSAGGTHAQSESFGWNAAGWSSSGGGNIGTLDFDETRSLFTVTGTVRSTSDHNNITSVSTSTDQGVAGTATRNGNDYRATITAINNLYHDSDVSGTWTATFTKPTSVSSATDRTETLTTNWTRSYTTGYKTWAILNSSSTPAESLLGTLSASGYSATETRSGDTSTSTWRGRTYTFNNSAGSTSMTGYLIAPSSIDPTTSFTNPDVQNAVYSGVTRTEINLGQPGHQVAYYFYTFTVGAGNTIRVTVA